MRPSELGADSGVKLIDPVFCLYRKRQWQPTPALLPGKSHGRRRLVGCSPWGREESDTTERLHFHFSLSCMGEGNSNPLPRLSNFTVTFHFHALEKEMATHSSVLAWRIPGMAEPGGLPSVGSHRVGHNWSNLAAAAVCLYYWLSFLDK